MVHYWSIARLHRTKIQKLWWDSLRTDIEFMRFVLLTEQTEVKCFSYNSY